MPKYQELKVSEVWNLVKDDEEINSYFSEYEPGHYPERDFLYAVLSSIRGSELLQLIKTAKNNRAYTNQSEENEMIQMTSAIKVELFNILPRKSKHFYLKLIYE